MQSVRVLQVVAKLNIGGLEMVAMNYLRYMDKEKLQFDFLVYGDEAGALEKEAVALGSRVIHMRKPRDQLAFYFALKKTLKKYGPYDVVYSHTYFSSGIVLRAAKACGVPKCIAHAHSTKRAGDTRVDRQIFYALMRCYLNRYADIRVACSKAAGDNLYGVGRDYLVLNNGIDTNKFAFNKQVRKITRDQLGLGNAFVVGSVGRLTPEKNHVFLVDTFVKVQQSVSDARLLIVGDGPLKERLQIRIKEIGIGDKTVFTGTRQDIPALLSAMDVFVFPSLHEGLGISAVEAQAAGLAVVCSDTIPAEVAVTELLHFMPLKAGTKIWAETIARYSKGYPRRNMAAEIATAGYELKDCMKTVQQILTQ